MTDEEKVIYAAGLLDGEGSIDVRKHSGKSIDTYFCIQATMIDKEPLQLLLDTFGGSLRFYNPPSVKRDGRKPYWRWAAHGNTALQAYIKLRPYLIIKRCREIESSLEMEEL